MQTARTAIVRRSGGKSCIRCDRVPQPSASTVFTRLPAAACPPRHATVGATPRPALSRFAPRTDRGPSLDEAQLNIGRALDCLRDSLPLFLQEGLVDTPPASFWAKAVRARTPEEDETPGIYSNSITFTYVNPELDRAQNFSITGKAFYLLSATILRRALLALFISPEIQLLSFHSAKAEPDQRQALVKLRFVGRLRWREEEQDYVVVFRYLFDERGKIIHHLVERIIPAPGQGLLDGLWEIWSGEMRRTRPIPAPT